MQSTQTESTPSGSGQRPTWPARWLIRLAVLALPGMPARVRYRRELEADLVRLPRARQFAYAMRVVSRAWALRRAMGPKDSLSLNTEGAHLEFVKPVLCRINVHHEWKWQSTEDGQRYRRCVLCGKDDDGLASKTQAGVSINVVDRPF